MIKIILSTMIVGSLVMASGFGNTRNVTRNSYNTTNMYSNTYTSSTEGSMELRNSMGAMSSVELNPDHKGWSVGTGISAYSGEYAGAVGIMYGGTLGGTSANDYGINLKAYQAEGGYHGVAVGFTIGF